jgi:uracil-DNA glycosylase family 4
LANCEECPLYERGRYVPSHFPDDSSSSDSDNHTVGERHLAFVGEAPARYEVAKGEPFVGMSGQLLNSVLNQYGVDRSQVLLTNAVSCNYPDSMKKLPKEAIEACRPRLMAELKTAGTTTVVPMGNSAVQSVFPKEQSKAGITSLRAGLPKQSGYLGENISVVPTFHPAACLRSQEKTPYLISDIGKAVSAKHLPRGWYEPNYEVVQPGSHSTSHIKQILESIRLLNKGEAVYLDIETGREKDVSFGNVLMEKMLCIGIGPSDMMHENHVYVFTAAAFQSRFVRDEFMALLDECRIVCQNGKFDIGVLRAWLGYPDFVGPVLSGDTMLKSYSLNEYGGVHGLEYMGMELLGCPDWKHVIHPYLRGEDGKGDVDYANIPRDILYKYNAFDVHVTRLLDGYLGERIDELGLTSGYNFTLRISNMLTFVEPRGMGFDIEYSQGLSDEYDLEKAEFQARLPIVSDPESKTKALREPHTLNPDSPKQVTQYYHANGVMVENTEADTLSALLPKYQIKEEVKETTRNILAIRGITKMDGTFVRGLREKVTDRGTVHPSFLVHGTTSGRLSARNPNSQNIPRAKQIKKQFIPSLPGRILVGVDMSQAELRVLTWLAKEEVTREIFNDPNRDLFVELCRSMFPDLFAGQPDPFVKGHPIRPLVKGFAYGMAYGRTAAGIAADPEFNMDVREAQGHMNLFQQTVPEITKYLEGVADKACRGEALISPWGRHRRFHLVTDMNRHAVRNEAKSFPAQSTASDIVLEAACRLTFDHQVYIINLVHDAIYSECTPDEAPEVAALISKTMIQVGEELVDGYVKFDTEAKFGNNWAEV